MNNTTDSLKNIIKYYKSLLSDFCIPWTKDLEHKVIELYPNDIAIENYMMTIILSHLK